LLQNINDQFVIITGGFLLQQEHHWIVPFLQYIFKPDFILTLVNQRVSYIRSKNIMGKKSMIILYVKEQEKSKEFYSKILNSKPVLDVPGMTEFDINDNFLLGLMPESSIIKILNGHTKNPVLGSGIPRCELYLFVNEPEASLEVALNAGANLISHALDRDWGDKVAYCSDPDGHIIAFAK